MDSSISLWDIVKGLAAAVSAILAVLYGALMKRIDKLETRVDGKVDSARLDEFKRVMDEYRKETAENFKSLNSTLTQVLLAVRKD